MKKTLHGTWLVVCWIILVIFVGGIVYLYTFGGSDSKDANEDPYSTNADR